MKSEAKAQMGAAPFYKSNGEETRFYEGYFKAATGTSKLALLSDDGTSVWIDGQQVLERAGQTQGFEGEGTHQRNGVSWQNGFEATFSPLAATFEAGKIYHLKLQYTNTIHSSDTDVDGLSLWAYDGGGEIVTVSVDLQVEDVEEAKEETDGTWVALNEGTEEGNESDEGNPIWDIWPDATAGHRINSTDKDLADGTLRIEGSGSGKWKLDFADKIKVWRKENGGEYQEVKSGEYSDLISLPQTISLKLEGLIVSSQEKDATLTAKFQFEGASTTSDDKVALTVIQAGVQSEIVAGSPYQPDPDVPSTNGASNSSVAASSQSIGEATAPLIDNFPPLLTYNPNTQRLIKISNLPKILWGKTVTWKIKSGLAELRNGQPQSPQTSLSRPVDAKGNSQVYFRTTASGTVVLQVLNPANNRQINAKTTIILAVEDLAEADHQANHVPNEKWKNGHNYFAEKQNPSERLAMKNTLFYCQEPNTDTVELRVNTTLPNYSGKKIWWRYGGIETDAGRGSVGYYEYKKRFSSDGQGLTWTSFKPRSVGGVGGALTDYASGLYTLSFGIDTDGDAKGEPDYWHNPSSISFRVQHVSINERGGASTEIIEKYMRIPNTEFTRSALSVFMYGAGHSSSLYTTPTPTAVSLLAGYDSLTHIAGAHFGGASSSATINRYTWGSDASERVYASLGLRQYIARVIKAPSNTALIKAAFSNTNQLEQTFTIPIDPTLFYETKDKKSVTVGSVEWDKSSYTNFVDYDCFAALGGVSISQGSIRIVVVKQADGTLKAARLVINGYMEDLNDYDYHGASVAVFGPVSKNGASVQIGWVNNHSERKEGNIFFNRVNLGQLFVRGDGYNVLEYISQHAIETISFP